MKVCRLTVKLLKCAVVVVFVVLLAVSSVGAMFSVVHEDVLMKWKIDNPHVDQRYQSWEENTIEGWGTLCVPSGWSIREESGIYQIVDDRGEIWALGTIYETETAIYSGYTDFFTDITSTEVIEFSVSPYPGSKLMNGSLITEMTVQFSGSLQTFMCIELWEGADLSLLFVVMQDDGDNSSHYQIAEAILYYYAYSE